MKVRLLRRINEPREKVWDEYTAPGNRIRWDPTLVSYETIQGKPGHPGALAHVTYSEHGVALETTEWVTERTEPAVYRAVYDSAIGVLRVESRFDPVVAGTRWTLFADIRFKGFKLKLLAPILRGRLRKRLERDMDRFIDYLDGDHSADSRVSPLKAGETL